MERVKRHRIQSRTDGRTVYTVTVFLDDLWAFCTCPGWANRKRCAHADHVIEKHYSPKK